MDLPSPKAKKHCKLPQDLPFPVVLKKDGALKKISGHFNGFCVVIDHTEDMKIVISKGCFGKANFSRSYPQFERTNDVLRTRQFLKRQEIFQDMKGKSQKVIVVPDSDSESEDYFINLQPKYELDYSRLQENVWLGLEEAFFLESVVKCLNISYNENILNSHQIWDLFQSNQQLFVRNYVAYFYYRMKNWVVKPGIKFGGNFVLYKQGPPFYHSSYVIVIDVIDYWGKRIKSLTDNSMDMVHLLGLNRLCETAGKELIICRITWPQNNDIHFEDFTNIEMEEILLKRWIASQEKDDSK